MSKQDNRSVAGPNIVTDLPGKKAKRLVEADGEVVSPSSPRAYPLAVESAQGLNVTDVDGNRFWDFASGIAVTNVGHRHPKVVEAAKNQLDSLVHPAFCDYYSPEPTRLAERLEVIAPGNSPKKVFFGNSGAEAVEAGMKLARHHTGRHRFVAFEGGFHGRTMGALSLTASKTKYKRGFGPLVPGVDHIPYPKPGKYGSDEAAMKATFDAFEDLIRTRVPVDEIAAIVVEPVQGEGGYVVPPEGFHERLREFADDHGILLIADEVQSGFGRTGEWFGMDNWGVEPDITLMGKGIANGLPMSAMVAKETVMTWGAGTHASTYHGNPVAAAAANAVIDVIDDENLLDNATEVGAHLMGELDALAEEFPQIAEVRGLGLMIGAEFVDPETGKPDGDLSEAVMHTAWRHGLMILPCGQSTVRFAPPLTITKEQATVGIELFGEALAEALE
ncbi:acetyl ornithine aminotransferase family protein [Haladaptatus sp. AB618]|uniref:acetyl ornithine aminotransferase family protein n=1 Tax=Haladaptatus sp. AB618 TaxID=2934173 RepID=UPI00209C247E|nr:acetyl ornithine aminotransferase family protein [Haladaptatus sp. AB618]MCO8254894.1 acetyl ornithine aminotransferase family protein [Haladaptatus sp. AB618]